MLSGIVNRTIVIIAILITSCSQSKDIDINLAFNRNDININCNLTKIVVRDLDKNYKKLFGVKADKLTYIYGTISIKNISNSFVKYNLNQYYLYYNNIISSGIYIDSVASYIILESTLKPHENVTKSVYWVFDGVLTQKAYKEIKLVLH
ncbi:MAG: hypothetical protein P4L44_10740 [Oryzomonas sp.]|uniref:hypothetical protein n=1 Tax=Oryzomonas sp. TaxID=2855186 RepID=UPI00284035E2|nr:hypothetical protein [Oryzomonas sp.]MDR3580429.1 hypothetical protein [Oryzomonas sp.]